MFGKVTRLRKLIDKHQDSILGIASPESKKEDTPPPPSSDGHLKHDVVLDVSADAFEKLLYGFIRNICASIPNQSADNMSDDIVRLCLNFYNTGVKFFVIPIIFFIFGFVSIIFMQFENLKFDLYNAKYCNVLYSVILKSNMKADAIACHRVFCSSVGWNVGVHKWKIKYIGDDDESIASPYGGIGIVSDNKILRKDNQFGNHSQENSKALHWINHRCFGNVYYFDQRSHSIYNYQFGKGKVLHSKKKMRRETSDGEEMDCAYRKGDVLTVILDCNRWKLKILKNDQNILMDDEEITIRKKYITYYPVLAFYHHGDTYKVLTK